MQELPKENYLREINKKYLAIHMPDHPDYISPRIWHPFCIMWWSGLFGMPAIVGGILVRSRG